MKILQINSLYGEGSTGKITKELHYGLLDSGIESIVCYGRGANTKDVGVYRVNNNFCGKVNHLIANITGLMYGGCYISTRKTIRLIMKVKPDIVHIQCINGNFVNVYKLVKWLNKSNIKTVLTLHAEFMYTANCGHALDCNQWQDGCKKCENYKNKTGSYFFDNTNKSHRLMMEAFKNFENLNVVSVSPWLMNRAKHSIILKDKKHSVIYNGLDTNVFKVYNTYELKKKHNISTEKIIFHATPWFDNDPENIKGGYYVLKMADLLKAQNIKIMVAGNYDKNLLIPENMIMLGKVNNQEELAKYYSMADVTLLTSRKETFSMVTAESLCCGTPVIGFKAGAPEQIAIPEYSLFVDYGKIDTLINNINFDLKQDQVNISNKAIDLYSSQQMLDKYIALYKGM